MIKIKSNKGNYLYYNKVSRFFSINFFSYFFKINEKVGPSFIDQNDENIMF